MHPVFLMDDSIIDILLEKKRCILHAPSSL